MPDNGQPQPLIALVKLANGQLSVQGPVDDLVMSLGLLELAKQLVVEHNKQKEQRVVPVAGVLPPPLRR